MVKEPENSSSKAELPNMWGKKKLKWSVICVEIVTTGSLLVDWVSHVTGLKPHMTTRRLGRGLRCFSDKQLETMIINKKRIFYYTLSFWTQEETTMLLWIRNTNSPWTFYYKQTRSCCLLTAFFIVCIFQTCWMCLMFLEGFAQRGILVCPEIYICFSTSNFLSFLGLF